MGGKRVEEGENVCGYRWERKWEMGRIREGNRRGKGQHKPADETNILECFLERTETNIKALRENEETQSNNLQSKSDQGKTGSASRARTGNISALLRQFTAFVDL